VQTPERPRVAEVDASVLQLGERLEQAIREALPLTSKLEQALEGANGGYKRVAQVLVELRHALRGRNGEPHDLRGRSAAYR
jgi:hypothetical protein